MPENPKNRLPSVSWKWQDDRYVLFSGERPLGYVRPAGAAAEAGYGDQRWLLGSADPATDRGVQAIQEWPVGRILGQSEPIEHGREFRGAISLSSGRVYPYRHRQDVRQQTTLLDLGGRPLLEYREESANTGRITVHNSPAVSSEEFPMLLIFGLYLTYAGQSISSC